MSTIWEFDHIESKYTLYCGKDCMKKFCESLREHAKNITDLKIKKNITVNKRKTKITSRCKNFFKNLLKIKIIGRLEIIVIILAHSQA